MKDQVLVGNFNKKSINDLNFSIGECTIEENTDYPGMDLNPNTGATSDSQDSALACRDLCNQNKDCKYFGWKAHGGQCWLKSEISGKVAQSGTTSGNACRRGKGVYKYYVFFYFYAYPHKRLSFKKI